MRYRFMATYLGVPYHAGLGPDGTEVTLFSPAPPPEDLGFTRLAGHWRKKVSINDIAALWQSRLVGEYRGERCLVLDDLGDRLHIAYLGRDTARARQLGYWEIDREVFEVVVARQEVLGLTEERVDFPLAAAIFPPSGNFPPSGAFVPSGAFPGRAAAEPQAAPAFGERTGPQAAFVDRTGPQAAFGERTAPLVAPGRRPPAAEQSPPVRPDGPPIPDPRPGGGLAWLASLRAVARAAAAARARARTRTRTRSQGGGPAAGPAHRTPGPGVSAGGLRGASHAVRHPAGRLCGR